MGKPRSLKGRRRSHIATIKERIEYLSNRIAIAVEKSPRQLGYLKQERASLRDALQCMQSAPLIYAKAERPKTALGIAHSGVRCEKCGELHSTFVSEFHVCAEAVVDTANKLVSRRRELDERYKHGEITEEEHARGIECVDYLVSKSDAVG